MIARLAAVLWWEAVGFGSGWMGEPMAQIGPMLQSVLRLMGELEPSELRELPAAPLPVRLQ